MLRMLALTIVTTILLLVIFPFLIYLYSKMQALAWYHVWHTKITYDNKLEEWTNGKEKRHQ